MRDPKLYLKDILEAIEAIENFIRGMDFETFKNDDMRASAVIRKFEINRRGYQKTSLKILNKNIPLSPGVIWLG